MYDYNEALSVISRTTLNERQVHLCQVYVARILGGGDYLQNSKIFFASLGSLLNQCGQFAFHGNCVGDSALEFHSSKISSDTNSLSLMLNNPIAHT